MIFDIDLKDQDHLIDLDLLAMILIFNGRILIFLTMILIFFGMILIFDLDHFQSDLLQPWIDLNKRNDQKLSFLGP